MNTIEARLLACERENVRLHRRIARQNRFWLTGLLLLSGGLAIAAPEIQHAVFDSVRAKEIVVVDANGIVRARLGGDLPDGVMAGGHVAKRGSKAGGLLIYDEEGVERGGYVTQDTGSNAMLTLDSKMHQSALFVAGPGQEQVSALRLWSATRAIELRSDANGARLSASDKTHVTYQQPVIAPLSSATCLDQQALERQYPGQQVCRSRYTEAACDACLHGE